MKPNDVPRLQAVGARFAVYATGGDSAGRRQQRVLAWKREVAVGPAKAEVLRAKRDQETWVLAQPGVEGLAISRAKDGAWFVKVYTNHAAAETKAAIRARFGTVPVVFEETGAIHSQRV